MNEFDHLSAEVAPMLELSKKERKAFCNEDRWVGYTRAIEILGQLDDLVNYPHGLRMPNILVVGRSGNGKSSIVERFRHSHEVRVREDGGPIAPVLHMEMPDTPDQGQFWSAVLWALLITHRETAPAKLLKKEAKSALQYAHVSVLVIDEFNNLINAGRKAGDLLASIKELSNALKISIVAFGTQAAINALNSEPQMKSRFQPAPLQRWHLDAEYLRFLASYERLLPLAKPSGLATRELAPRLYDMGGDTIGGTVKLLKASASLAIDIGTECITNAVLDKVNWTGSEAWEKVAAAV